MTMRITATPEQLRAAMRTALSNAGLFGVLDDTADDFADRLEEAVEGLDDALAHVLARPCPCELREACPHRGTPPGEADTGHCQQCGWYLGNATRCEDCDATYLLHEEDET